VRPPSRWLLVARGGGQDGGGGGGGELTASGGGGGWAVALDEDAVFRYLAEEAGLGRDGAAAVIAGDPRMLGYSIEKNIAPAVGRYRLFVSKHASKAPMVSALEATSTI
jgi:hypothetical protein